MLLHWAAAVVQEVVYTVDIGADLRSSVCTVQLQSSAESRAATLLSEGLHEGIPLCMSFVYIP